MTDSGGGLALEVSDPDAHLAPARERVPDAGGRAEQLAALSDAEAPGAVVAVSEGGAVALRAAKDMAVEPGERSLDIALTVTWSGLSSGRAHQLGDERG
ncbi:MAG: hypothetical protein R2731_02600 [Nocardioides sp.]